MGSGSYDASGRDGSSSLEHSLDQAIARRFASVQERPSKKRRLSPMPMMAALNASAKQSAESATFEHTAPLFSAEQSAQRATSEQTAPLGSAAQTALTVTNAQTALAVIPCRLSWRGIEVTDEFQLYAARVALGEELAPYRGAVLSRPCSEFPWGSPTSTTVPTPTLPRYPERRRSLSMVLWLGGAALSIVGALGVGAGAAATSKTDNGVAAYDPVQGTAALRPTPTSAREASPLPVQTGDADGALETSLAAELAPVWTQGGEPPIATALPQSQAPTRSPDRSRPPEALSRAPAASRSNGSGVPAARAIASRQDASRQDASRQDASRVATPLPEPSLGATAPARGAATRAPSPASSSSDALPVGNSTLFADSPSF